MDSEQFGEIRDRTLRALQQAAEETGHPAAVMTAAYIISHLALATTDSAKRQSQTLQTLNDLHHRLLDAARQNHPTHESFLA